MFDFLVCADPVGNGAFTQELSAHDSFDAAVSWLKAQARRSPSRDRRAVVELAAGTRRLRLKADRGVRPGRYVDTFTWDGRPMSISGYGGRPPYHLVSE